MKRKKVDLLKASVDNLNYNNRIIAHIDLDCFYVQVERSLDPSLNHKPVGVVQYNPFGDLKTYLPKDNRLVNSGSLIAVSYEARAKGVKRIMRGNEAKKECPELLLVQVPTSHGKADLKIYRDASSKILKVLTTGTQYNSCIIERASIDEVYVDVTVEANKLLKNVTDISYFLQTSVETLLSVPTLIAGVDNDEVQMSKKQIRNGHSGTDMMQSTYNNSANITSSIEETLIIDNIHNSTWFNRQHNEWITEDLLLIAGSIIINHLRKAIYETLGFTCSAGISTNRMLAKICSGMHKPNKQTILPISFIPQLMENLPYSRIQGLGGKLGTLLDNIYEGSVKTMGQIALLDRNDLLKNFGEETTVWLLNVSKGIDLEPVLDRALPISIGCSKTFRNKNMLTQKQLNDGTVLKWLTELAEELQERINEDTLSNSRIAKSLQTGATVKILSSDSTPTSSTIDTASTNNNSIVALEDRMEQWHEDQGISLSKICPMVPTTSSNSTSSSGDKASSSSIANTALTMLTRAISEHPKITCMHHHRTSTTSSHKNSTTNITNNQNTTNTTTTNNHNHTNISWCITSLSLCVTNFQTIENGAQSITSYFKTSSKPIYINNTINSNNATNNDIKYSNSIGIIDNSHNNTINDNTHINYSKLPSSIDLNNSLNCDTDNNSINNTNNTNNIQNNTFSSNKLTNTKDTTCKQILLPTATIVLNSIDHQVNKQNVIINKTKAKDIYSFFTSNNNSNNTNNNTNNTNKNTTTNNTNNNNTTNNSSDNNNNNIVINVNNNHNKINILNNINKNHNNNEVYTIDKYENSEISVIDLKKNNNLIILDSSNYKNTTNTIHSINNNNTTTSTNNNSNNNNNNNRNNNATTNNSYITKNVIDLNSRISSNPIDNYIQDSNNNNNSNNSNHSALITRNDNNNNNSTSNNNSKTINDNSNNKTIINNNGSNNNTYQLNSMQDIDSSVYLSLPYEIQREIELTMKLRNQRKIIKKSLFLNDSLSYFENSKQYLDNKNAK